ncbi:MoaD/ThiS family protein [Salmonella enterica]|nr:MoaD/ThiS family protein [Salmonella enterica]EGY5277918.1 MoaD/ThiS family protein [Salmonella enterica]EHG4045831.1 MoaD/ThiS family protein [Salmonella enterica]EHM7583963.1 MoaD/ThiS family protein [Salmonella enterica]EHM7593178.1 MoaD/ThiS family protein [Salmonella enterica]
MKLTVEYLSQLKEASGVNTETFVIDRSILLNEFIKSYICKNEKLAEQLLDEKKEIKKILIVFLNDNICTINETVLKSDATITLMFPIAGG